MINNIAYYYNVIDMKKNYKVFLFYTLLPLVLGGIVGLITSKDMKNFNGPIPGWIFPIVWTILYILMGISSYLVRDDKKLIRIYIVQLIINLLWSILFFSLKLKVVAFFWILLLIIIVGIMIYEFHRKNRLSSYLLIPYLIWLIIASILNLYLI